MKVFVGGISGSGKSALAGALRERGYSCVDDAYDETLSYWADKASHERVPEPVDFDQPLDWIWDKQVVLNALGSTASGPVFVCGNAANQSDFYPLFDALRVLVADNETIQQRIAARTTNSFGKKPSELAWILEENQRLTDELIAAGAQTIDATQSPDEVVRYVLASLDR